MLKKFLLLSLVAIPILLLAQTAPPQLRYVIPIPTGCTVSVSTTQVVFSCAPVVTPSPLTLTTPVALPPAIVGIPYLTDLSALAKPTGGVAPYSFKALSGLPPGLGLASSGIVSGTPLATGSFTLSFTVTDSSSSLAAKSSGVQINVQQVPSKCKQISDINCGVITGVSR